jgi:hypothetical protein
MSMISLKCPKCSAEAKLYLSDTSYSGPRRCWKCHENFWIEIYNNQVTSCDPLSQEDFEAQMEAQKATEKAGGHYKFKKPAPLPKAAEPVQTSMDFSKKDAPAASQKPAQAPAAGITFSSPGEPATAQKPAQSSGGGISFSSQGEPGASQKPAGTSGGGITFSSAVDSATSQNPPKAAGGGIDFVKKDEPVAAPKPVEKKIDIFKSMVSKPPSVPSVPSQPKGPAIFPPDKPRTFVPEEDIYNNHDYSPKSKTSSKKTEYTNYYDSFSTSKTDKPELFPPDAPRTFIPIEDVPEDAQKPKKSNPKKGQTPS